MPRSRAGLLPATLKGRMTGLVALLVLAAAVTVTLAALALAEADMKSVIGNHQYAAVTSVAGSIDDRLDARSRLLALFAENLPPAVLADPRLLADYMVRHPIVSTEFFAVLAVLPDGRFVGATDQHGAPVSARGKPYFEQTLARRRGVVSAPFKSRISGHAIVLLTQPVYDAAGALRFMLVGSIDLEAGAVVRQIDLLRPGRTGIIFIMTGDGTLVDHPDRTRVLANIHDRPGVNGATERALAGFEGWTEATDKDGDDCLYAYKRLRNTDWIVGVRYPTAEAFAPLIAMQTKAVLAAAVCAVLAGVLGWFAVARMLGPLERLRADLARGTVRRPDPRSVPAPASGEIGELAGALYTLTEQRQAAQERTRASEELLRAILERAPDAFVTTDTAGFVTEWNRRAEEMFGWTRAEAMGRDVALLIIPPHLQAAHRAGLARLAASGPGTRGYVHRRVQAVHRDGREVPVELSIGAVQHGGVQVATAFLHDISDRQSYEQQLTASEQRARIIADTMPALISYVDQRERFQFTNAYYGTLLGLDPRSMIGRTVTEVRGSEVQRNLRPFIDAALRGERQRFESVRMLNGQETWLLSDYIPDVAPDGSIRGFYAMGMDISERKRAELRLAASEKRLRLITDNLPVLISYVDRLHHFQFGNATFEAWFGIAPAALVDRPLGDVIGARAYAASIPHLERAFAGAPGSFEFESVRDNAVRVLQLTMVPDVQPDGTVPGVYTITHDLTDIKAAEAKLIRLARLDSLTGIANRRMFGEALAAAVERARRHRQVLALAYLDVDHFKRINDSAGHAAGDAVLCEFARRLVGQVRRSDVVARLSGDEFVVILSDLKDRTEVAAIARKMVTAIRPPFVLETGSLNVTASVGVAVFDDGDSGEQLLANADAALYAAKERGRDGWVVYTAPARS